MALVAAGCTLTVHMRLSFGFSVPGASSVPPCGQGWRLGVGKGVKGQGSARWGAASATTTSLSELTPVQFLNIPGPAWGGGPPNQAEVHHSLSSLCSDVTHRDC